MFVPREGSRGNASGRVAITSDALSVANEAGNIGLMPAIFGISRQICANTASVFSGESCSFDCACLSSYEPHRKRDGDLGRLVTLQSEYRVQGSGFGF